MGKCAEAAMKNSGGSNVFEALNGQSTGKSKTQKKKKVMSQDVNWAAKPSSQYPTDSSLELGNATLEQTGSWYVSVTGASGAVSLVDITHLNLSADRSGRPLRFQERE